MGKLKEKHFKKAQSYAEKFGFPDAGAMVAGGSSPAVGGGADPMGEVLELIKSTRDPKTFLDLFNRTYVRAVED